VNLIWTVLPTLQVQASQFYRSSRTTGRGRLDPFFRTNLSVEKTLWDERGTLGLEMSDPFQTSEIGYRTQTERYAEQVTRDWTGRSVSLSFSYQFGRPDADRRGSPSGGTMGPMGGGGGIRPPRCAVILL